MLTFIEGGWRLKSRDIRRFFFSRLIIWEIILCWIRRVSNGILCFFFFFNLFRAADCKFYLVDFFFRGRGIKIKW